MLNLVLASLVSASVSSPPSLLLQLALAAPAAAQAGDAPASRRVCHNVPVSNSRFTRRVCSTVVAGQAAVAQAPVPAPVLVTTPGIGMAVVDGRGGAVGTIIAVAADSVTVQTDRHKAQLPKSSLTISDGKALFGLSQAELNASVERTQATMAPALQVGAAVKGTGGGGVGTIDAVETDNVTIRLASGLRISIPRSGISATADGGAVIGLSAAELEAQVKAAQPPR